MISCHVPEELFTILFVQLRLNVLDGVFNLWNDHIFNGVDSSICRLDDLVQDDESGLQINVIDARGIKRYA